MWVQDTDVPGRSAAVQTENTGCSRGRDRSAMCQLINCVGQRCATSSGNCASAPTASPLPESTSSDQGVCRGDSVHSWEAGAT